VNAISLLLFYFEGEALADMFNSSRVEGGIKKAWSPFFVDGGFSHCNMHMTRNCFWNMMRRVSSK
jgi:hypothetical protein